MTMQVPDELEYLGKEYVVPGSSPIEGSEAAGLILPETFALTTALWRGFVAKWRIADDQLVLVGLTCYVKDGTIGLEEIAKRSVVPARWFSGPLRVIAAEAYGQYWHANWPESIQFEIDTGRVIAVRHLPDETPTAPSAARP